MLRCILSLLLFSIAIVPAAEPIIHGYKKAGERELKLTIVNPPEA